MRLCKEGWGVETNPCTSPSSLLVGFVAHLKGGRVSAGCVLLLPVPFICDWP